VFAVYDETLDTTINAWGKPWVNIHFAVPPEQGQQRFKNLIAWAATDMADYARRAGALMCDKLKGQAGSVAVTQSVFSAGESLVAAEFTQAFHEMCPAIRVLAPQEEGLDLPAAIAKASAILTANPDLIGAFSTTGNGPSTWTGAAKDAGKQPGDLTIVSMDYTRPNLDLVRDGWVYALVGQPLYEEAYRAVEILLAHYRQEPFAYANMIPAPLITQANLAPYYAYADKVQAQGQGQP
jgi:ribose transport system substrate-binding protein